LPFQLSHVHSWAFGWGHSNADLSLDIDDVKIRFSREMCSFMIHEVTQGPFHRVHGDSPAKGPD